MWLGPASPGPVSFLDGIRAFGKDGPTSDDVWVYNSSISELLACPWFSRVLVTRPKMQTALVILADLLLSRCESKI